MEDRLDQRQMWRIEVGRNGREEVVVLSDAANPIIMWASR
jgi:hypothetical protein